MELAGRIGLFVPFITEDSGENVVYYPIDVDGDDYMCFGFVQDSDHYFTVKIHKDEPVQSKPEYTELFSGFTPGDWKTFMDVDDSSDYDYYF